ncbi:hypothetical protein DQG13_19095 [Paenibacillus sp. YN15]|nr:hypothetical protein DQG13_19095 [Paenibacillus sp. YN15]
MCITKLPFATSPRLYTAAQSYYIKSKLLASQEKMSALSVRGFMELAVFRLNRRYAKELERLQQTAGEIVRTSTRIRMIHEAFFALFALLVNLIKWQRLAFGRVMAQKRNMAILDEPASALDNKTEKNLMDGILDLFADKTLVIVAHRLRSIQHADCIVLVRNGEIAGIGDFASLMEGSPYFRELWSLEETGRGPVQA